MILLCAAANQLHAGGFRFVAGVSNFDPNAVGKPISWANGNIVYFTDQGNAGPMLPQSTANAFVADAISRWTSVPTAALVATRGGALAEDVNGSNIINVDGGISLPADIQPPATNKPLAIVYDDDGKITDALLGTRASDPSLCATNSVIGGVDRLGSDAHIVHALIIINGLCAQSASDLPPLKYHLIRVLGTALGLDWSQANDNVRSGSPSPGNEDYAGFPLMHPLEPFCGSAITSCIANADQLRMDDRATISRLYPVTTENISGFPGKQLFSSNTIRISGSIYFSDVHGNAGQPMQGVNVVARLIDPNTGIPSRRYVASCVSGFLFRGNAGNHVSGFGVSQRLDAFGSDNPSLEGFYDLAGLEVPAGQSTASYQITVEPVNPLFNGESSVGPYASAQVTPSGSAAPVTFSNLSPGDVITSDVVMSGSTRITTDSSEPNSFAMPSPVPASGEWWGSLSGYGDEDFFSFPARANGSFDFQVTALNEALLPTATKAQPELGVWAPSDITNPQLFVNAFNTLRTGVTELASEINVTGKLKLGIADYRGDGRPDYLYRARLLYADTVTPQRINSGGGPVVIRGIGFRRGMTVTVGGAAASIIAVEENQIVFTAPLLGAGAQDVVVHDASTGATTTLRGGLTYGLTNGDHLMIVSSANGPVPPGAVAPNPIVVRAVAADGTTPIIGVSVNFSVLPAQSQFTTCGSNTCSLTTDANGEASISLAVNAAGANTVTASLAGTFVNATISGSSTATLFAIKPLTLLLAGSSTSVLLPVRLLSGGVGIAAQPITYTLTSGTGSLSAANATTAGDGSATTSLTVTNISSAVSVVACTPSLPCATISVQPVTSASLKLQKIGGDNQLLLVGQSAQPISVRVTDSSTPPHALANIPVTISGVVSSRPGPADCNLSDGVCRPSAAVLLSRFSTTINSGANGLVSFTPTVQTAWGPVQISIVATAGDSGQQALELKVISPQP
jgi:hypothetical protein